MYKLPTYAILTQTIFAESTLKRISVDPHISGNKTVVSPDFQAHPGTHPYS